MGTAKNNATLVADISSITINGDVRGMWWKYIYQPHTVRAAADDAHRWIDYTVIHTAFDCRQRTSKINSMQIYYDDGTYWQATPELIANRGPESVPPDTSGETVLKFVCAWKPK